MANQPTLLVTGASGQMGRRVLDLLLAANTGPIIAATRSPEKLADYAQRGVTVRPSDFEDTDSMVKAFTGADKLLLISTDVLDGTDRRTKQHIAAVEAAEKAGVKHVLYTSITKPEPETPVFVSRDHYATEQALTASKMGWTFLRNNIYSDLQVGSLNRALQMGKLFAAAGDGKTAYITREDCSRAAAAALMSDFEGRRILDITGPEALSQTDLAKITSDISGKQIEYVPLDREVLIQNLVGAGVPRVLAEVYTSFDAGIALGKMDVVTNTVEELTGQKPQRFADFLTAQRDALLQGIAS